MEIPIEICTDQYRRFQLFDGCTYVTLRVLLKKMARNFLFAHRRTLVCFPDFDPLVAARADQDVVNDQLGTYMRAWQHPHAVCSQTSATRPQTLLHYMNFNDAASSSAYMTPSVTLSRFSKHDWWLIHVRLSPFGRISGLATQCGIVDCAANDGTYKTRS